MWSFGRLVPHERLSLSDLVARRRSHNLEHQDERGDRGGAGGTTAKHRDLRDVLLCPAACLKLSLRN